MFLEWNLREDILEIAHSWQVIFIVFLIGSLFGWGVAFILPKSYRAESVLYVAYNGDAIYRNPDDYKNWQLSELEAFIVAEPVLDATLSKLRTQDTYWEAVSTEDIRNNIHSYWRSAGKWRLVAETQDPERASQLVQAWQATVIEQVGDATTSAVILLELSGQIGALAAEKVSLGSHAEEVRGMIDALLAWRNEYEGGDGTTPITTIDRWHLQTITTRSASLNPIVLSLIDQIPSIDAPSDAYISWVDQIISIFENELAVIENRYEEIEVSGEELEQKVNEALDASHGLTTFLIVEPISGELPSVQPVRFSSQTALVGGVLGVLLLGFIWLGRPIRKGRT